MGKEAVKKVSARGMGSLEYRAVSSHDMRQVYDLVMILFFTMKINTALGTPRFRHLANFLI
jgi:hypothetical protein